MAFKEKIGDILVAFVVVEHEMVDLGLLVRGEVADDVEGFSFSAHGFVWFRVEILWRD